MGLLSIYLELWSGFTIFTFTAGRSNRYGDTAEIGIWDQETWNPYYSPVVMDIKILAEGYISNIQLQQFNGTGWQFVTYGLFPCSYDLYIFCKLGIIPVIMLMAVLTTLSIFIVGRKEAHKPIRLIAEIMLHLKHRKRN